MPDGTKQVLYQANIGVEVKLNIEKFLASLFQYLDNALCENFREHIEGTYNEKVIDAMWESFCDNPEGRDKIIIDIADAFLKYARKNKK